MNKLRQILARFLYQRHGQDALNITFLAFSFAFFILSLFDFSFQLFFSIFSLIFLFMYIARFISRNKAKRMAENQSFLLFMSPLTRNIKLVYKNITDQHRKYFLCPVCKRMLRIPRRKGKVEIKCPTCHQSFKAHS